MPPAESLGGILEPVLGSVSDPLRASERVVWLVQGSALVDEARRQLAAHIEVTNGAPEFGAMLWPGIRSLRQTAEAILGHAAAPVRPLSTALKHRVVLQVLDRAEHAGRLEHYGRIQQRDQLARVLASSFAALGRQLGTQHLDPQQRVGSTADAGERELSLLYRHYQQTLAKHQLLDAEGRLAFATRLLREGQLGPLSAAEQVCLCGIRSLNPLEGEFVQALGTAVGKATLFLPALDSAAESNDSDREEVNVASPVRVLQRLVAQLSSSNPKDRVTIPKAADTERENPPADLNRVSDWLFQDPRRAPVANASHDADTKKSFFTEIAAPGVYQEMQQVATEVKRLLLAGMPAEAICITSRNTKLVSIGLKQAFREVGVPLHDSQPPALTESSLAQSFSRFVALVVEDWPREELLAIVTSPALTWFDGEAIEEGTALERACHRNRFAGPRAAAEWALRSLLLPAGRDAWLAQLRSLARRSESEPADPEGKQPSRRKDRLSFAASIALELLTPLVDASELWATAATPLDWFDRLRKVAAVCGYRSTRGEASAQADQAALEALERATAEAGHLAGWQGRQAAELTASEWQSQLGVIVAETSLPVVGSGEGCVRLLPPETARMLKPDYLFMVGMTEQSFPAPPPASPIASLGKKETDHYSEEMLLFYELIHSACRGVTFSYPSLDAAGQPLNPSSYVAEVQRLLGGISKPDAQSHAGSSAVLRRQAVIRLNEGSGKQLSRLPQQAGRLSLLQGLRVSLDRSRGDGFGAAEGMLIGGKASNRLSEHYNSQHLWSPSQLELFATCPFKFFMRQVLGIDETPELQLATDHRRRGSLLHDAMLRLHGELKHKGPILQTLRELSDQEFQVAFQQAIEASHRATLLPSHQRPLAEIEVLQAEQWGELYREQLDSYSRSTTAFEGAMQPAHFEVRFGPPREGDPPLEAPSRAEPFALSLEDEQLLITGQVDRIDVAEVDGRLMFNVVDYKTAKEMKPKLADLGSGRQLQLYLYTLATEELLRGEHEVVPWRLGYWVIRSGGFVSPSEGSRKNKVELQPSEINDAGAVVETDVWSEYGEAVRHRITQMVHGVRSGEFPMFNPDEDCAGRCEFSTTCRVSQTRSLGKVPPESASGVPADSDEQEAAP